MKIQLDNEGYNSNTGKYKCPYCDKEYTKKGICTHIGRSHTKNGINHKFEAWNKGKTKEDNNTMNKISKSMKLAHKEGRAYNYVLNYGKGKNHSNKTKLKISEGMKLAHKEKRAYNYGLNRGKGEPSYPEKFFMRVIDNEFIDKNYNWELPIGKYSLDFAGKHKNKVIEIDGEQHEKPEHKESDKQKDLFLESNGGQVLRIKGKDIFHNPQKYIKIGKNFIDN